MLRKWLNGYLMHVVTTALGLVLAAAAGGTWKMSVEFQRLQQKVESRSEHNDQRFMQHESQLDNLRRRVRWLEQNRNAMLTLWDFP